MKFVIPGNQVFKSEQNLELFMSNHTFNLLAILKNVPNYTHLAAGAVSNLGEVRDWYLY